MVMILVGLVMQAWAQKTMRWWAKARTWWKDRDFSIILTSATTTLVTSYWWYHGLMNMVLVMIIVFEVGVQVLAPILPIPELRQYCLSQG